MTYNGYTNYQTWCVNLWLNNEEDTYRYWVAETVDVWKHAKPDDVLTRLGVANRELASRLRDVVESGNPLQANPSMYSDILTSALQEVNWQEIASAMLEEYTENN